MLESGAKREAAVAVVGTTAGRVGARGPARRSLLGREWRLAYLMTLPVVVIVLGLVAYPLAYAVWLSTQDVKIGGVGTFVGLGNYGKLLFDSTARINAEFWNSVRVTAVFVGGAMVGKFILGMTMALILNAQIRARNFFRALLFLPWAIPAIVGAYSWKWIYNDINGVLNSLLQQLGLIDRPILFLADPSIAIWALLAAVIWQGTPFWTMTFLAGLSSIPNEMYEAAEIDGASTFRSFWAITLPNLTSVIVVTLMLSAIWTTNSLQFPYILTGGGPGNATMTFPLLALTQGLRTYDLGIAATITLIFFPLFAVMIYFLTRRMLRLEGEG
jgi:multiple sugar transport system permease protein